MRFYDIQISGQSSQGAAVGSTNGSTNFRYTSHPKGTGSPPDPGALQVEMDLFQLAYGQAGANSWVKIWGVPIETVAQGSNLNFKNILIRGGMGKGLPLANPRQAGLLVAGQITQAFGNWIGTDMSLDLVIIPGYGQEGKPQEPRNMTLQWRKNTPLKEALDQVLQFGYPNLKRDIQISDKLKLPNDEIGFYATTDQLAQYIKNISRKIIGAGDYPGVDIVVQGDTVYVRDGTVQQNLKEISPLDLIGQPTWIGPLTVQVTMVMRGDLRVNEYIKLPPGLLTTRASSFSSLSPLKGKNSFQGKFMISKIRHVGNFKQPDGRAWSTIVDALFIPTKNMDRNDIGPGIGIQTGPGYT